MCHPLEIKSIIIIIICWAHSHFAGFIMLWLICLFMVSLQRIMGGKGILSVLQLMFLCSCTMIPVSPLCVYLQFFNQGLLVLVITPWLIRVGLSCLLRTRWRVPNISSAHHSPIIKLLQHFGVFHLIHSVHKMSRLMTKPTKWRVCPGKTQISLIIRPVWSESSLSTWRKLGSLATHWAHSQDSDQTGQMPRLIWVFAGHTVILLVLSWGGSNTVCLLMLFSNDRSNWYIE